jgi:hypothetical protein
MLGNAYSASEILPRRPGKFGVSSRCCVFLLNYYLSFVKAWNMLLMTLKEDLICHSPNLQKRHYSE